MNAYPSDADLPYLEGNFVELPQLTAAHGWQLAALRADIDAGRMPQPTYQLADNRELVPPDYFALAEAAGSSSHLRDWFASAYSAAARDQPDADPLQMAWSDYLSGGYGVCLRNVTPTTIVRKSVLVVRLERMLAVPEPQNAGWLEELGRRVDALDVLEREFCAFDRQRSGSVSRDRLITEPRRRYLAPRAAPRPTAVGARTARPEQRR
jgi:Family of unknown function (DUF6058)